MLALRECLIPSISKDLLWKQWETITPNEAGKHMGVHRFATVLDDMPSKSIDKQGHKSITDEVKIQKFLNNIPHIIKKSITLHLTDDMSYNDMVTKLEQFQVANLGATVDYTKPAYSSNVSRYTHATSTCASYSAQQQRPDKDQPPQNRLATAGARSIASAGTTDSHRDKIKPALYEKERMRHIRETPCSWYGLAGHDFKGYWKRLNKVPIRTAAQEMRLQQPACITKSKKKTKQKPQVAIREPLTSNRVFVKWNGHQTLPPIDLQTIGGDLISTQFVCLYKLLVVKIEPKTLATAIKESTGTVDKSCEVELN